MGASWYQISHFERPDSSYPDYDRYFGDDEDELWTEDDLEDLDEADPDDMYYGYDDFEDEFVPDPGEEVDRIVDMYCGKLADKIINEYWKMGPPTDN